MRLRYFLMVCLLGFAFSSPVFALSMGAMKTNSTLNQHLDAEIELTNLGNLTEAEILPNLATLEDFQRVGIDRNYALNELRFEVVTDGSGVMVVKVTSIKPVVEPYLNFLVEVLWPTGRILREYTILLDPPSYDVEGVQPLRMVQSQGIEALYSDDQNSDNQSSEDRSSYKAPAKDTEADEADSRGFRLQPYADETVPDDANGRGSAKDQAQRQERDRKAESSRSQTRSTTSRRTREGKTTSSDSRRSSSAQRQTRTIREQQIIGNDYGMTVRGDTLWSIATRTLPDGGVSMQQAMLALRRTNPDAFINDNINLLKAGYLLRIPSAEEMQEMGYEAAVAEVQIQNDAFEAYKSGRPIAQRDSVTQLDATGRTRSSDDGSVNNDEGELRVLASGSQDGTQSGSGAKGPGGQSESNLSMAMEDIDSLQRENSEYKMKMDDLQSQLEAINEIVKLKDDQLAALKQHLKNAQGGKPIDPETLDSLAASSTPAQNTQDQTTDPSQQNPPATAQIDPAAVQDQSQSESPQTDTPKPMRKAKEPKGMMATAMAMIDPFIQKLKSEPLMLGGILGAVVFSLAGLMIFMRRRRSGKEQLQADEGLPPIDYEDTNTEEDEVSEDAAEEIDVDDQIDEDFQADSEDPISDADTYMEFEKYPEAIALLRHAIDIEPERPDLRLKLLEVFVQTEDASAFNQEYASLRELDNHEASETASQMQEQIPGAAAEDDSLGEVDLGGDDNLDLDSEPEDVDLGDLDDLDLGLDDDDDISLDLDGGDDEISLDLGGDDDEISLDLDGDDDEISLDLGGDDDEISLDLGGDDDEISLDLGGDDDEISLDLGGDDDEISLDFGGDDDEISLDLGGDDDEISLDLGGDDDEITLDLGSEDDDEISFDLGSGDDELSLDSDTTDELDMGLADTDSGDDSFDLDDDSFSLDDGDLDLDGIDLDLDGLDMDVDDAADNKLDLARAYIDMGDKDGARDLLQELVKDGSSDDAKEANELLAKID